MSTSKSPPLPPVTEFSQFHTNVRVEMSPSVVSFKKHKIIQCHLSWQWLQTVLKIAGTQTQYIYFHKKQTGFIKTSIEVVEPNAVQLHSTVVYTPSVRLKRSPCPLNCQLHRPYSTSNCFQSSGLNHLKMLRLLTNWLICTSTWLSVTPATFLQRDHVTFRTGTQAWCIMGVLDCMGLTRVSSSTSKQVCKRE